MKHVIFMILLFLAGLGVSVQGTMNGGLGKVVGVTQAALFSFLVGTGTLFVLHLVTGAGNLQAVWSVPKWQLLGGFIGAFYVSILAMTIPKIGIGLSMVIVVVSQIMMSLVIDHFGWFQSTQVLLNPQRLIGAVLLIAGMIFIYRGT